MTDFEAVNKFVDEVEKLYSQLTETQRSMISVNITTSNRPMAREDIDDGK